MVNYSMITLLKQINDQLSVLKETRTQLADLRDQLRNQLMDFESLLAAVEDGDDSLDAGIREIERAVDSLSTEV